MSVDESRVGYRNPEAPVELRVCLFFALMSLFGGLVLSGDSATQTFALIAISSAVFGFIVVDWMQLVSLPALPAYIAMVVSAVYCVSEFVDYSPESPYYFSFDLYRGGEMHLIAVSQLLVLIQSILMMQVKTRRVCEQLCIFCLLELIVAAVFNYAIGFGILLLPMGIVGAIGLASLSVSSANSEANDSRRKVGKVQAYTIPKHFFVSLFAMLLPAVCLIAATFFYAIPRTIESARQRSSGTALVGFNDDVRLEQFGQMQQNNSIALRAWMTDRASGLPYKVIGGLYLRGRTLESYEASFIGSRPSAKWSSIGDDTNGGRTSLPREFHPPRTSDRNFFDDVRVTIDCEPIRSDSLFAVAPYHRNRPTNDLLHNLDRWTVRRWQVGDSTFPRLKYSFGSYAFQSGIQSDFVARLAPDEIFTEEDFELFIASQGRYSMPVEISEEEIRNGDFSSLDPLSQARQEYTQDLLPFDSDAMPTIKLMADALTGSIPQQERNPARLARQFEQFLSTTGGFEYTLNLDSKPRKQMDPIEQFMAIDRKGHCQYFASALAMMLRCQGIPTRLVVGYYTDEFNELGEYYIARQSHAHAWVEALVSREDLGDQVIYGQPNEGEYWLRLDPTPGISGSGSTGQGVTNLIDLAQTFWQGNVIDRNTSNNSADNRSLNAAAMSDDGTQSRLTKWIERKLDNLRTGQLGGGALASRSRFSWIAAAIGGVACLTLVVIVRLLWWVTLLRRGKSVNASPEPKIEFYASAIRMLSAAGYERRSTQTAIEFSECVSADDAQIGKPLRTLTDAFNEVRFGIDGTGDTKNEIADKKSMAIRRALDHLKEQIFFKQTQKRE